MRKQLNHYVGAFYIIIVLMTDTLGQVMWSSPSLALALERWSLFGG